MAASDTHGTARCYHFAIIYVVAIFSTGIPAIQHETRLVRTAPISKKTEVTGRNKHNKSFAVQAETRRESHTGKFYQQTLKFH